MPGITPFLWFDTQALVAAEFYVSVFSGRPGSGDAGPTEILDVSRYGPDGPGEPGTVMTVSFRLDGQPFTALNGGPEYRFTEAVSFAVTCDDQAEVDNLWNALTDGGEEGPCGWLKDRFGLSWQIVPAALSRLMADPDPQRAAAVTRAMLGMKKLEIAELERARDEAA
jgi:predicted 3-demethylubiquinone-9 3-methyltransferase (glyoxalase superfamily)